MKKYVVDLNEQEKERLEDLSTKGKSGARKIRRARILLLAEEGYLDEEIARALGAALTTVERIRKRFAEEGLEAALSERPRPGAARKLNGHQRRRIWWLWLVATRRRARSVGACGFWPIGSWSLGWSMRSPTRRSGARSKRGS